MKSAKRLEQAGEKAVDTLADLAGSVLGAARAMNKGEKGAAAFNSSIDQAATGMIGLVTVLGLLVPLGRALKPLGGLLSILGVNVAKVNAGAVAMTAGIAGAAMAAKGFTDLMKAANEQADKLYKGYSDLAKSGAVASDGLTGVFEDAKKFGIAVTELDSMVSIIAQNATELALFGGGVVKGRQQLAAMGRSIEGSQEYFLSLGYDMTAVTETMADYIKQQRVAGDATVRSAADIDRLGKGAQRYLEEQDALTKLTGMARQEQEKAREAVRSQERFAAQLESLRQKGKHDEAKALEDTFLILQSQNKEAAQGFADIQTGNVQTEAAQKSLMGTQGESMRVAQQIIAGQMGAAEGAQRIARAHGETARSLGTTMGMIGTYNQTYGDLAGDLKLAGLAEKDIVKILETIEKDRQKLADKEGKGADKMLTDQARLRATQIRANEAVERFVNENGLPAATLAAQAFASAVANGTEKLNELFGEPEKASAGKPPPSSYPAAPTNKIKPRPADPLKAQIWDSQYASGWNPDGTPKTTAAPSSAAPSAAPSSAAPSAAPSSAAPSAAPAPAPSTTVPSVTVRLKDGSTRTVRTAKMIESFYKLGKITEEERNRALKELGAKPSTSVSTAPSPAAPSPAAPAPSPAAVSIGPRPDVAMPGGPSGTAPSGGAISPDRAPSSTATNEQSPANGSIATSASPRAIDLIKSFEGFSPKAHWDNKQWSIGYGTRTDDPDEISGKKTIDESEALARLNQFVQGFTGSVAKYAAMKKWGQNQFDAAMSFVYNLGPGNLDRLTDEGNRTNQQIADSILLYTKSNDPRADKGLSRRRGAERDLFLQDMPMLYKGGITRGPSIAGEAGPEAVVPLPDGKTIPVTINLRDELAKGETMPGVIGDGYLGYNRGPMSTDLEMVAKIAGKLGAYDAATQTITDPKSWMKLMGMAMNYDMGYANMGSKSYGPEIADVLATAIKDNMQGGQDIGTAILEVGKEFQEVLRQYMEEQNRIFNENERRAEEKWLLETLGETMKEMVREQARTADASQRIAQAAVN
jgi:GH24 family phage-related lysozyme (muramidase)